MNAANAKNFKDSAMEIEANIRGILSDLNKISACMTTRWQSHARGQKIVWTHVLFGCAFKPPWQWWSTFWSFMLAATGNQILRERLWFLGLIKVEFSVRTEVWHIIEEYWRRKHVSWSCPFWPRKKACAVKTSAFESQEDDLIQNCRRSSCRDDYEP